MLFSVIDPYKKEKIQAHNFQTGIIFILLPSNKVTVNDVRVSDEIKKPTLFTMLTHLEKSQYACTFTLLYY